MSLLRHQSFRDRDGNVLTAHLANGVNVQRTPSARDHVLLRTLHSVERAGVVFTVEKTFVYIDRERGQMFLVRPPRDRFRWRALKQEFAAAIALLPADLRSVLSYTRLVFGLEELREKLVAHERNLDDRAVELMKVALMHEHPVLLARPRLRLSLDRVDEMGAHFRAAYDHHPKSFEVTLAAPEVFCADEAGLRRWSRLAGRNDLYQSEAHDWVNYRRMLPGQSALADLNAFARRLETASRREAQSMVKEARGKPFATMLARLPRGSALSSQGKSDLQRLSAWAKARKLRDLQDRLFEIRFDKQLEDDWSRNRDANDIDTLWTLLRDLPPDHVEGNVKLREIALADGGGGSYDPSSREIEIGRAELDHAESLQDTIRHEIGHAVHASRKEEIDAWLRDRWGWREFAVQSDEAMDEWLAIMGGWTALGVANENDRAAVRAAIRESLGPGEKWGPRRRPALPRTSVWKKPDFAPRLAYEKTGEDWYEQNESWFRANGHAFFYNFYYRKLMVVKESTLDFVNNSMPDRYAAQSPAEFFAELYALYYDVDDKKRVNIPADVSQWFATNLGRPAPPAPSASGAARLRKRKTPSRKRKS